MEHLKKAHRRMAPCVWYGGKGLIYRKILPFISTGKVYVEPYCGMASLFWHLPKPYPIEVLNDLSGDVVNLFRVLQDRATFEDFKHRVVWTPYALDELRRALSYDGDDPVMKAWSFYVRVNMLVSGNIVGSGEGRWSRCLTSTGSMARNTSRWRKRMAMLDWWHDRLTRVQIENSDALEVIERWDSADTIFYLDPPYIHSTRKMVDAYAHEMGDDQHQALVNLLLVSKGKFVLSGYRNAIYKKLEQAGWNCIDFETKLTASVVKQGSDRTGRTETLWLSPSAKKNYAQPLLAEGLWEGLQKRGQDG